MPSRYSKTDSARVRQLARIKGFEPLSDGSQPPTLSIELNPYMVSPKGLEPLTNGLEIHCSRPLSYGDINFLVPTEGFEPPTCGLRVRSSPAELSGHILGGSTIITNLSPYCSQAEGLTRWSDFQKTQVQDIGDLLRLLLLHRAQLLFHHRTKTPISHCNYCGGAEQIRTADLVLTKDVHCHLCYGAIVQLCL